MATQAPTMAVSDFNLEKLSTEELSEHISSTIAVRGNISIFGRRGTGKTEISKQQIKKSGLREVYINLSVLERVDLGGYPNIMSADPKKKFVDFLLPQFYQPMLEGEQGVVALLDEVDKADPSLWAPLLEFTQFRSINGRKLENLQAVVMTGNLISEGGSRPSLPLLDRAEKYLVEADVASWMKWAGQYGNIHPAILAYILDYPKDLFGAVDPDDRYADPSPRGWSRSSEILHKGEALGWSKELLNKKVCGCVGKDAGLKYSSYYAHYQQLLPMIDAVYEGKNISNEYHELDPSKKLVACMISCARLATQLDLLNKKDAQQVIKNVGKFMKIVPPEHVLVAVRSQITTNRIIAFNLDEDPEWGPLLKGINKSAAV